MTEFFSAPFYSTWEVYGCLYVTDRKSLFAEDTLAHVESNNDDKERGNGMNQNVDCIPLEVADTDDKDSMDYIENVHDDEDDGSSVLEDSLALTVVEEEEELFDYDQTFCRSRSRTGLRISTAGETMSVGLFSSICIFLTDAFKKKILLAQIFFQQIKSHFLRFYHKTFIHQKFSYDNCFEK